MDESQNDPIIDKFLDFIANDISQHLQHLTPVEQSLFDRIESLVTGVEFDLNEPLSEEEEQITQIHSSRGNK
jgi:antitoxin PrlF